MSSPSEQAKDEAESRWFHRTSESRDWEDFYRNRWEHDTVTRSTHGVNCSGSCSWQIFTKNDIISWELQQTDYPQIDSDTPNYEPRGCQRGISTSWYPYSPVRPKHPYVRGKLLEFYREEKEKGKGPVEAYAAIVEDPERSTEYKRARGKGGWRRVAWDEATELVAAAQLHTILEYGPDRLASFSPIPAMSMVSWISGERLNGLLGGSILSFYEYYHDLPHIEPMIWGDQTDVAESADWYQSDYWIVAGTNLPMTRTADAHFASEFKYDGGKITNLAPDYSDVTKFADTWVPVNPGTDGAFLLACVHVILQEFFVEKETEYFREYVQQYTNLPFLVELGDSEGGYSPGHFLRAEDFGRDVPNADGKPVMEDEGGEVVLPKGTIGTRWEDDEEWNLKLEDVETGEAFDPQLSFLEDADDVVEVRFPDFTDTFEVTVGETEGKGQRAEVEVREVPARRVETEDGEKLVATAFDLLMAHMGTDRGLDGDYPEGYDDSEHTFTPTWQESETGVDRELVTRVAREWAETARATEGQCMFISGSGALHWYHGGTLTQRAMAIMGILTGCMGKNGGGFNNYVGTEKVRPYAAVPFLGSASDWYDEPRLQNNTSYMYFHTDQHRYDGMELDPLLSPDAEEMSDLTHAADANALAVRNGWLPFYPQFDGQSSIDVARDAQEAGATTDEEISEYVRDELVDGDLDFAIENVDDEPNHPKVLWAWRGNLTGTSTRGHEYMLKHLFGTHDNVLGEERANGLIEDVDLSGEAPTGKLDLIVNMNFRMDSTANYADVVLPAAHWYEKYDVTCTDLHSFFHPFTPAQDPPWETKHDWEGFKEVARQFQELAQDHFDGPVKDVVLKPLMTDTEDEIANLDGEIFDWTEDDVEPVPGETMPKIEVVERDYTEVYDQYVSLGPNANEPEGFGAKGVETDLTPAYEGLKDNYRVGENEDGLPDLDKAQQVAETIMRISPETDGAQSKRLFETLEEQTGLDLSNLYEGQVDEGYHYDDLVAQPKRTLTSPHWSGIEGDEGHEARTYAPWMINVEELKPWNTLTGRQEVYFDHEGYQDLGEFLPTYKPPVDTAAIGDVAMNDVDITAAEFEDVDVEPGEMEDRAASGREKPEHAKASDDPEVGVFRFLTPHGKWQIHSNFRDSWQMTNLSRGGPVAWINDESARRLGIEDNDWIELFTNNGIQVCRAVVSHTVPRSSVIVYHQVERHVNVPFSEKAQEEGVSDLRGGTNNSETRIMQNPANMIGGYANWTYFINYWGTSPSERDMPVAVRKMPDQSVTYREEELDVDWERVEAAHGTTPQPDGGDPRGDGGDSRTDGGDPRGDGAGDGPAGDDGGDST